MKLYSPIVILVVISTLMIFGCKSKKEVVDTMEPGKPLYYLAKGACFGRCPVFELTVMSNGIAEYKGQKFTKLLGTYQKKLTADEMSMLASLFSDSDFSTFLDDYESQIPDLPLIRVGYASGSDMDIKIGKENRPDKLVTLQNALDNIANQSDWKLIEALQVDEEPSKNMIDENLDKSKFIIQHKPGTQVPMWFNTNREAYGIRIIDKDAESGGWLITYSTSKFEPEEIMKILQEDEAVIKAEFLKVNK